MAVSDSHPIRREGYYSADHAADSLGWRIEPLALEDVRSSRHAAALLSRRLNLLPAGRTEAAHSSTESGLSVAVLLFTNQSGDPTQDYFADGLTEDITRALGRFRPLTVLAYGSVLPYRDKQLSPMDLGRALNARFLVSGSDDWFMAPDDVRELARAWGSRYVLLERGGHINTDAGFGPWPEGERLLAELIQ